MNTELKFKRLDAKAQAPRKAHPADAGYDLTCTMVECDANSNIVTYHTGLSFEIPNGYVGLLFARSSIYKTGQSVCNSVGVIDSNFRGEVMLKTYLADNEVNNRIVYKEGERCCQLVILKLPEFKIVEAAELSKSDRGTQGYGSTGA